MITHSEFSRSMLREFPYSPTPGQQELIYSLAEFIISNKQQFPLFLLEGYAGTGKTTVVSTLVKVLSKAGYQPVLLAPTGRAAKVLASYAGQQAFTIHRWLYRPAVDVEGKVSFRLMQNKHVNLFFIIDEASMIPDDRNAAEDGMFRFHNLLEDLIQHVFEGNNCKMLLLGDTCQLPPVGISQSPALDMEILRKSYYLDVQRFVLTDVVRQALESGILSVANAIRSKIGAWDKLSPLPLFGRENGFSDVLSISGNEMPESICQSFSDFGRENTVIITRSNKRANQFNKAIRERILFHENELAAGDLLMVVRNNYFWLPEGSKAAFIANGDIVEVLAIRKSGEMYGFRFAEATVRLLDYPDEPNLDVKLLLNTLETETPSLSQDESNRLFREVMLDYEHLGSRSKRMKAIRNDPFFNALQVKHASALTCHKTQGGQWNAVYIEKGFLKEEMIDREYLRWLYTAVTRARLKLFLINFDSTFFE